MPVIIRAETSADVETINEVTKAAFATLEISDHAEHQILDAFRAGGPASLT